MDISVIIPGFGPGRKMAEEQAARLVKAFNDSMVEVIVADGCNPADARNHGLDAAKGEWIAWVDADDEIVLDRWLPAIRGAISSNPSADFIVFDIRSVRGDKAKDVVWSHPDGDVSADRLTRDLLADTLQNFTFNKVVRRSLWQRVRFDTDTENGWFEDYPVMPRLASMAKNVYHLREILYNYIFHKSSITGSGTRKESFVRAACRRAEEWSRTPYADEALAGAARLNVQYLEDIVFGRIPWRERPFAKEVKSFLRRNAVKLLLSRACDKRLRMKILCAATGCWLPQTLAWRIHGVQRPRRTAT